MFKVKAVFLLRIIGAIFALLVSIIISRILTIDEAGNVFFLLSITGVIASLSTLGQNNLILKKCASINFTIKAKSIFFSNCIIRSVVFGLVLSVILIPVIYYFSNNKILYSAWYVVLFLIIFSSVNILLYSYIQSQGKVTLSIVIQYICQPLIFMFFVFFCFLCAKESGFSVSLSYLLSVVLVGSGGLVYVYRCEIEEGKKDCKKIALIPFELRELSEYFIGNSLGMIIVQSYVVLSGLLLPSSDVAIIAVSDRISLIVNLLAMSISAILAPRIASLYSQGKMYDIKVLTRKAVVFITIPCVFLLVIFPFVSDFLLSIFGAEYRNASEILLILVLAQVINAALCPIYVFLNMSDKQGFISKLHIYMLIPALGLSFYLTHVFGIVGIAISKLIVITLINLIPLIYSVLLFNRITK
ncbi:oligosaccharide flippase family protein [Salmonella enterica]|nr:oligosaccharide flippase family protein [Salmonella enterica]EJJ4246999.1 oligosaccharide flippase family protein [Salmonella enterica]